MKNAVIFLIVILVFLVCGYVGYQLATRIDPARIALTGATPGRTGQGEQHNLVIIQVDQLDSAQPRLVSVWFASLFFMEGESPRLSFGQLFPTRSDPSQNQSIARSFGLDGQGDPSTGFWRSLDSLKIKWEGYLLVDNITVQRVLEWINGPGDYPAILSSGAENSAARSQLAGRSCKAVAGIDKRQGPSLQWGDLVPAHFRSNLRMEDALAYWNRVTTAIGAQCEILPSR